MRVGDDELAAAEDTLEQAAQELAPEGFGLALAAVETDHLPTPRLVHAVRDHQTLAHDAAAVADLLHLRVEPQVRVAPLEWPAAERLDLLIEAGADPRDLRAGDPQAERLDQLVDPAGRDTADVRLLDNRDERLLRSLTRLQEAREIGAAAQLPQQELGPWVMPATLLDTFILAYPTKRYQSAWIGIAVHSAQRVVIAASVLSSSSETSRWNPRPER